jgi:hypothetical protein
MAHDVLWDALRMNMMISYQELVRTFPKEIQIQSLKGYHCNINFPADKKVTAIMG